MNSVKSLCAILGVIAILGMVWLMEFKNSLIIKTDNEHLVWTGEEWFSVSAETLDPILGEGMNTVSANSSQYLLWDGRYWFTVNKEDVDPLITKQRQGK